MQRITTQAPVISGRAEVNPAVDRCRRLRRAVLSTVVAGVPLVILYEVTLDPFNVPKLALLTAGTGVAMGLKLFELGLGGNLRARSMLVPATAVAVPLVISWIASPHHAWGLFGTYSRFQGLIPMMIVALFGLLVADSFAGDARPLIWASAVTAALIGLYALIQMLGLDPLEWSNTDASFAIATIGHSNFTGGFLAVALPYALYLWWSGSAPRWLAMTVTIAVGEGIVLTNSQGAWLAALAGGAVTVGLMMGIRNKVAPRVGLGIATIAMAVGVGIVGLGLIDPGNRLVPASSVTRGWHWRSAVGLAATSPVVGRGPNAFGLEGVLHRPDEEALLLGTQTADDPHSVPLGWLAASGAMGAGAFLVLVGWTLRLSFRLRRNPLAIPFIGAAAAYVAQSLVSIDEPTIRVALWTTLGGLAALASTGPPRAPAADGRRSIAVVAGAAGALTAVISVGWAAAFVVADARAEHGIDLFEDGRPDEGAEAMNAALAFREETHYRGRLAERLGFAALDATLDRAQDGDALFEAARRSFAALDELPDLRGRWAYARLLKAWGSVHPDVLAEAEAAYREALELDPNNPPIRIELAETLILEGRADEAVEALDPLEAALGIGYPLAASWMWWTPDLWATRARAELELNHPEEAAAALGRARRLGPGRCRTRIASEVARVSQPKAPPPSPKQALNLALACDAGLHRMFLDLLPPERRADYS